MHSSSVKQPGYYPYSAIGKVTNESGFGTGCLIDSNIVLTAAQNCFNVEKGVFYDNISFIPAPLQDITYFKGFKALKVYIPTEYKDKDKK